MFNLIKNTGKTGILIFLFYPSPGFDYVTNSKFYKFMYFFTAA